MAKSLSAKALIAKFEADHPRSKAAGPVGGIGLDLFKLALPYLLTWLSKYVDLTPKPTP